jgi:hypothetical protein
MYMDFSKDSSVLQSSIHFQTYHVLQPGRLLAVHWSVLMLSASTMYLSTAGRGKLLTFCTAAAADDWAMWPCLIAAGAARRRRTQQDLRGMLRGGGGARAGGVRAGGAPARPLQQLPHPRARDPGEEHLTAGARLVAACSFWLMKDLLSGTPALSLQRLPTLVGLEKST